jgi:hypothetical protein
MPISNVTVVNILVIPGGSTRASFGPVLFSADLSPAQDAAFPGSDNIVSLTRDTFDAVLTGLGITSSELVYADIADHFGQARVPEIAYLGKRADAVAQVTTIVVTAADDGNWIVNFNGTPYTHVSGGSETITQIRDGMITALAPISAVGTVAAVLTDTLTITAVSAGIPFISSATPGGAGTLTHDITTPNVGVGEDIAAYLTENTQWYVLGLVSRDADTILTAAAAIEPRDLYLFADTNDADVPLGTAGNVLEQLAALNYTHTSVWYTPETDEGVYAAVTGRVLPVDPGATNWANKQLVGVTGRDYSLTPAELTTILGNNGNALELYAARGVTATVGGKNSNGDQIDVTRGVHFMKAALESGLFDLFTTSEIVPFSEDGIAQAGGVVEAELEALVTQGLVLDDTVVVTLPDITDPSGDAATGKLPDITFQAIIQVGATRVDVNGTVQLPAA